LKNTNSSDPSLFYKVSSISTILLTSALPEHRRHRAGNNPRPRFTQQYIITTENATRNAHAPPFHAISQGRRYRIIATDSTILKRFPAISRNGGQLASCMRFPFHWQIIDYAVNVPYQTLTGRITRNEPEEKEKMRRLVDRSDPNPPIF
jgi:hypothetical protein